MCTGFRGANGGGPWQEIEAEFRRHKYELIYEVVDTADYGVPQHRERLIMVGVRDGTFVFPLPTHGPDAGTGQPLIPVLEAIKDLQDPQEPFHDNLGGLYGHLLPKIPEGLNYAFFTSEMGCPEPVFAWRSKFHDLLYKVNRNEPCRTIKAHPGKFTGPFHWKNRHFTLPELKRLQTYPDDYELEGSFATQLEQIGNSVPPRMAEVFARSLREQIFDRVDKFTYPVRPSDFKSTFRRRQRSRSARFRSIAEAAIAKQYDRKPRYGTNGKNRTVEAEYTVEYSTLFSRNVVKGTVRNGLPGADVTIRDEDGVVELDFRPFTPGRGIGSAKIAITGLRKYLPEYDALTATCTLGRLNDVFHAWKEIEVALTARSRFFTLIDIYGHYANRGDVVDIESAFSFSTGSTPVTRAIEHFSQTRNCGDFLNKPDLIRVLRLKADELPAMIESLRGLRYDFRSNTTHPILGEDRILCTYPFPLLSPRALVESRVTFLPRPDNSKNKRGDPGMNWTSSNLAARVAGLRQLFEGIYADAQRLIDTDADINEYIRSNGIPADMAGEALKLARLDHAFRGAALTLLGVKHLNPAQDIRAHKAEHPGGFAARSLDTRATVLFLIDKSLPRSVETHWLTQTLSFADRLTLDLKLTTRPKQAGPLLIKVVNVANGDETGQLARGLLGLIVYALIEIRNKDRVALTRPRSLPVVVVDALLRQHMSRTYKSGAPRLPQIAVYAIYACLIGNISRFEGHKLEPLERMKSADRKSGTVGDVVVSREGEPVEAVEIKYGQDIQSIHVLEAIEKVRALTVSRYYLLSTSGIAEAEAKEIFDKAAKFQKQNGCEIIVNGVFETVQYYLRLLPSTTDFIKHYADVLEDDEDVGYEHRIAWNECCAAL